MNEINTYITLSYRLVDNIHVYIVKCHLLALEF